MTIHTTLNRRTALKAVGSSMLVGSFGSVQGFSSNEFGTVRLIEAGIRYQFEEDAPYDRYHLDGLTDYWIDTDHERLLLRKHASPKTKSIFKSSGAAIKGPDIVAEQARLANGESTKQLTTNFSSRMRVNNFVSLAEPISEPTIFVDYSSSIPELQIGGNIHPVNVGQKTISLQPRTVVARTRYPTNEKGDVPGVPDRRMGYKLETGTKEVTVQPEVTATNFGELDVIETVR